MEVNYFFRHQSPRGHSIEELFLNIINHLPKDVRPLKFHSCFKGAGIYAIIGNLFWAFRSKGGINHITGDINYIALALPQKSIILTILDLRLVEEWTGLKGLLYRLIWFTLPAKHARYITVISKETRRVLLKYVSIPKEKVHVIPCCVSPLFNYAPRAFHSDCPVILQIGTKENKNLIRLSDALRGINCQLKILGKPTPEQESAFMKNSIQYNWVNNFSMEGVAGLYRNCDLVCFVSTYEGFGLPIVEAQASGRPVVTSNLSSMPEVAGNGACLVDPYDANSIHAGVLRVIEDVSYRKKLISRGFENVKRFRVEAVAKQYAELYRRVANTV